MSRIGFCEHGQMDGIKVTPGELKEYARAHGRKFVDEVMPLPGKGTQPNPEDCGSDHDGFDNAMYWESTTGSHGWCCQDCGLVIQWG